MTQPQRAFAVTKHEAEILWSAIVADAKNQRAMIEQCSYDSEMRTLLIRRMHQTAELGSRAAVLIRSFETQPTVENATELLPTLGLSGPRFMLLPDDGWWLKRFAKQLRALW